MLLSIIIINEDAFEYIPGLLDSIFNQIKKRQIELILIDNSKESNKILENYFSVFSKLYSFNPPIDYRGILYNKGSELASGDYLLFAHSDILLCDGFIDALFDAIDSGNDFDFANVDQLYVEGWNFGRNQLFVDYHSKDVILTQPWNTLPDKYAQLIECSESCFIVNGNVFKENTFKEEYQKSYFDYEFIKDIYFPGGAIAHLSECRIVHYFIETHEQIKYSTIDKGIWMSNNENIFRLLRDKDEVINSYAKQIEENKAVIEHMHLIISEKELAMSQRELLIQDKAESITQLDLLIQEKDESIAQRDLLIQEKEADIAQRDLLIQENVHITAVLNEKEAVLNNIFNSNGWKLLNKYYYIRDSILPDGSKRRLFSKSFIHFFGKAELEENSCHMQSTINLNNNVEESEILIQNNHSANCIDDQNHNLSVQKAKERKILLVSYYCPSRAHAGGLRILDIYSLIKERFGNIRLELYSIKRPEIDWAYDDVYSIFDKVYWSPNDKLDLDGLISQVDDVGCYDLIDIQFHQAAYQLERFRSITNVIIYTPMELQSRAFFIDFKSCLSGGNQYNLRKWIGNCKLVTEEMAFTFKADKTICVSEPDAAFLRAATHLKKITYLETGISGFEFPINHSQSLIANKENAIIFIAYFGSDTNVIALKWYLEKVHPIIKASVPDYTFSIVGRGDIYFKDEFKDSAVKFIGEVPMLLPYIEKAKIGIAPALSGAGFRGKVNQYAICGIPSIVSSIAAKGLAYRDGYDIFVADDHNVFAQKCIDLLCDSQLNSLFGSRARETCLKNYTWESKLSQIQDIYQL